MNEFYEIGLAYFWPQELIHVFTTSVIVENALQNRNFVFTLIGFPKNSRHESLHTKPNSL